MFSSFNFNLELIFQIEVERREHYLCHRLQIQLRNVLTFSFILPVERAIISNMFAESAAPIRKKSSLNSIACLFIDNVGKVTCFSFYYMRRTVN